MIKKVIILGLVVLAIAATSLTAFALTDVSTPVGTLAAEEGLWEEYKEEMLKSKRAFLDEKVTDGTITQDEADTIYNNIQEIQELCNGNGEGYGGMMGYGFGNSGRGLGQGRGCGRAWQ